MRRPSNQPRLPRPPQQPNAAPPQPPRAPRPAMPRYARKRLKPFAPQTTLEKPNPPPHAAQLTRPALTQTHLVAVRRLRLVPLNLLRRLTRRQQTPLTPLPLHRRTLEPVAVPPVSQLKTATRVNRLPRPRRPLVYPPPQQPLPPPPHTARLMRQLLRPALLTETVAPPNLTPQRRAKPPPSPQTPALPQKPEPRLIRRLPLTQIRP